MSGNVPEEQLAAYRKAFDRVDTDKSGDIDRKELAKLFKRLGQKVGKKELTRMMTKADADGNGRIDFDEFLTVVGDATRHQDDDLRETFKLFDKNGDGFIVASELKQAMLEFYGQELTDDDVAEMIAEADQNNDKKLDFNEFKAMMLAKPSN